MVDRQLAGLKGSMIAQREPESSSPLYGPQPPPLAFARNGMGSKAIDAPIRSAGFRLSAQMMRGLPRTFRQAGTSAEPAV